LTGRNEPCPCGSGKKYKKCCLPLGEELRRATGSTSTTIRLLDFAENNNIDLDIAKAYYTSDTIDLLTFKISELVLLKNLTELIRSIDLCIANRYLLSALKLIYTAIDNMAYLWSDTTQVTPAGFKQWADSYLLPNSDLSCTSDELYFARCGLLHQNTAGNRPLPQGTRYIFYSWGTAEPDHGSEHIDVLRRDQCTFVGIESLRDAFDKAMLAFLEELCKEPSSKGKLVQRSQKYFANLD